MIDKTVRALLVEDNPADARLMVESLTNGGQAESLLKYAEIAMYIAKRTRNQVCFYGNCKDEL